MRSTIDAKALSRLIGSFDSGRLSLAVLVASLLVGASLAAAEIGGIGGICVTGADLGWFLALMAVLAACLVAAYLLRRSALLRWPLGAAFAAGLVFLLRFPVSSVSALIFAVFLVLPLSLYPPFPRGALLSAAAMAVCLLLRFGIFPPEALGQKAAAFRDVLLLVVAPLFVTLSISMLAAFRAEMDRMAEALRTVTRLNLSYQDYNAVVEERSALQERQRIVRDIHDAVGYALTNTIMSLRAAALMCEREPERVRSFLDAARTDAERAHEQVREALGDLRKRDIRIIAGPLAIARVVRAFRAATGAVVQIDFGTFDWAVSGEAAFAISHFVQEGMLNAVSHGGASWIGIDFAVADGELRVDVRDNGSGVKTVHEGIGISGMRERLEKLGGDLGYESTAAGFRIRLRLPLERAEALA